MHVCMLCSDARLVWTFLASQNTTDAGVPAVQTLRNRSDATKSHALRTNVGQQFLIPYGALLTPCVLIGCSIMAASFMVRAY
jgi:hypothetical protein